MKRRISILIVFMLIMLFITQIYCSCEKNITDPVYTFSGVVSDSITSQPIDSAWIGINDSLTPYEIYTDSVGYYIYGAIGRGNIRIFCGKEGHATKDTDIYLNRNLDSINFNLSAN